MTVYRPIAYNDIFVTQDIPLFLPSDAGQRTAL